jgi:hypothetical protein
MGPEKGRQEVSQVKDGDIKIVPVDPFHPITGLLFPFILKRMTDFADIHYGDSLSDPRRQVRAVASELVLGNPGVLVLALLTSEGRLVGHVASIMQLDPQSGKKWLFVLQCKLDEPGADAISRAIQYGENFARQQGAVTLAFETRRSDSAWAKAYGFKVVRHIMTKDLNGHEATAAGVETPKGA